LSDRLSTFRSCRRQRRYPPQVRALSHQLGSARCEVSTARRTSGGGIASPRLERFVSEDAERVAGGEMALDVECVMEGSVIRQESHQPTRWRERKIFQIARISSANSRLDCSSATLARVEPTIRFRTWPRRKSAACHHPPLNQRSRTSPSSSTARQSQNCRPAITTAISSRCQRPVRRCVDSEAPGRRAARTSRLIVAPFHRRHPDRAPRADLQRRDS
jgi:hypothetical protein